jgi:Transglycosylase SLT domain
MHGQLIRMVIYNLFAGLIMVILGTLSAAAQTITSSEPVGDFLTPTCSMIDTIARLNDLPIDFFTRLLWQESRFQPDVIGPLTRRGEHAEGIAQFMPGTAAERGLLNPFNPVEALPKSAEFLAQLRDEFGNIGLAAAAYNAGPQRLRDFLAGSRDLPSETRHYVMVITGSSVEDWVAQTKAADRRVVQEIDGSQGLASGTCRGVVALLERGSAPSIARSQDDVSPSWCKGLHHPNIGICGAVHLIVPSIQTASLAPPRRHTRFRSSPR